jgi:hypothetical protein
MKKLLLILIIFILFSCERFNRTAAPRLEIEKIEDQEIELTEDIETEQVPDLDEIDTFEIDISLFRIINGNITTDYSVTDITNVHTSFQPEDLPDELVTENYLEIAWDGFRIILQNDIDIESKLVMIAIGGTNEYEKELQPLKISNFTDPDEIYGYYVEVEFENKPWLNNGVYEYLWQIIVKSGDDELINGEIVLSSFTFMFFNRLNQTPFVINNLRTAGLNTEYTYRFRTMDADILVIYYCVEIFEPYYGSIYKPILYILPENNNNYLTDVKISWNGEGLRGIYHIGRYKTYNLPREERVFPVFDRIDVR